MASPNEPANWAIYPDGIKSFAESIEGMVFVFGSTLYSARHTTGAARYAAQYWRAIDGQAEGIQGCAYGIPTRFHGKVPLLLVEIERGIAKFKAYARAHPSRKFLVSPIACVDHGFSAKDLAPFFADAPANCILPYELVVAAPLPVVSRFVSVMPKIGSENSAAWA